MPAGLTASQTVGPFLHLMLRDELTRMGPATFAGQIPLFGYVVDGAGEPMPDAMLELWQADAAGRYGGPPATATPSGFTGFARVRTDSEGRYSVLVLKPGSAPPHAPHIAVSVFARGLLHRLVTRIYFPDEVHANGADPTLGSVDEDDRRATLVAVPEGPALRFDITIQGDAETVFFAV
jgi:protocatechuate 3,4-dioxygenase alpha subunit